MSAVLCATSSAIMVCAMLTHWLVTTHDPCCKYHVAVPDQLQVISELTLDACRVSLVRKESSLTKIKEGNFCAGSNAPLSKGRRLQSEWLVVPGEVALTACYKGYQATNTAPIPTATQQQQQQAMPIKCSG